MLGEYGRDAGFACATYIVLIPESVKDIKVSKWLFYLIFLFLTLEKSGSQLKIKVNKTNRFATFLMDLSSAE